MIGILIRRMLRLGGLLFAGDFVGLTILMLRTYMYWLSPGVYSHSMFINMNSLCHRYIDNNNCMNSKYLWL